MKFVTYQCENEAIICVLETEHEAIDSYFTKGERNIDDYDREVLDDCAIHIRSSLK